jgi:hypothetical protein
MALTAAVRDRKEPCEKMRAMDHHSSQELEWARGKQRARAKSKAQFPGWSRPTEPKKEDIQRFGRRRRQRGLGRLEGLIPGKNKKSDNRGGRKRYFPDSLKRKRGRGSRRRLWMQCSEAANGGQTCLSSMNSISIVTVV